MGCIFETEQQRGFRTLIVVFFSGSLATWGVLAEFLKEKKLVTLSLEHHCPHLPEFDCLTTKT